MAPDDVYARLDQLERTLTERIRALGTRIESQKLWNGATLSDLRELQARFDALCRDVSGMGANRTAVTVEDFTRLWRHEMAHHEAHRCSESNRHSVADELPDLSPEATVARLSIARSLGAAANTDTSVDREIAELANYPESCFVIIGGDFIEGHTIFGPYHDRDAAEHHAQRMDYDTWQVVEVNRLA